jgi:hypothetical protein
MTMFSRMVRVGCLVWIVSWGAGVANADIPLPPSVKECRYLTQEVVQIKSCGSAQVCFAQMQCGFKIAPVSCLAKNGRCPEKPRDCAEDPQVSFVKDESRLPPVIMNSNGVQNGGKGN